MTPLRGPTYCTVQAINTFIELEKLTLSQKKCHTVHVGNNLQNCPDLEVHGNKMENSKQETYLGDKIDMSGRIKPTILSGILKGYGAISNILAITNKVPLAHWRIEAGLKLRQAMFLNVYTVQLRSLARDLSRRNRTDREGI